MRSGDVTRRPARSRPEAAAKRSTAAARATSRPPGTRRKIVELDEETFHALELLARDRFATFQELADEAFADLLAKHHRPVTLRAALKQSAEQADS